LIPAPQDGIIKVPSARQK